MSHHKRAATFASALSTYNYIVHLTLYAYIALQLLLLRLEVVYCYSFKPIQYHIQTDSGGDRYFRYQTMNGQYRKERLFSDGTVVGAYGWEGPDGILRLLDYFANEDGFRIIRERSGKKSMGVGLGGTNVIQVERGKYYPSFRKHLTQSQVDNFHSSSFTNDHESDRNPGERAVPLPNINEKDSGSDFQASSIPKKPHISQKRRRKGPFQVLRNQNYVSVRERLRRGRQQHGNPHIEESTLAAKLENLRNLSIKSVGSKPIERKTGHIRSKGKVTIDFDLGNQYRKEQIMPDGTVVGEHGYVDPFGILRKIVYSVGPEGYQQVMRSGWVGSRVSAVIPRPTS